ncbi:protein mlo2 [Achaetomium macrosporum]|uniref:Protein mlo2 n=1 Tax=Achaetomium macrosporum TaxID=79813 RepID=A0AAN7C837_9PEZI|nr:protein mlo2 [Achaetomium macrosporum]
MDPSVPQPSAPSNGTDAPRIKARSESISQHSDDSRTAADIIRDQLQLEADAREALPYSIEHCTKPLGALRQSVFACLTCNPPPANHSDPYNAAGVCYACSVQCHGEHTLVEIFNKRNFTCDCGTTRFPESSPCNLRISPKTNTKGGVHSEEPSPNNKYNQNFRNRFCGCECEYDPFEQKGTMFQCLGLGTHETGGCGEDWWHPGCIVGLGPKWFENMPTTKVKVEAKDSKTNGSLPVIAEDAETTEQNGNVLAGEAGEEEEDDDPPPPPGFPPEDDFEGFLCYKCVDAHPWIKRYAGTPGFLAPVFLKQGDAGATQGPSSPSAPVEKRELNGESKKRKAEDGETDSQDSKRQKGAGEANDAAPTPPKVSSTSAPAPEPSKDSSSPCKLTALPAAPSGQFSLFFTESFRSHLCHCPSCFPLLAPHPQLLEEEETYEPPVSEDGGSENDPAGSTSGGGSLYDRGESALRNVDRVRAIEGVMAYQHLKDKLMPFFQQFAESKQAISAEDIKEYFAKLRGDDQAIKEAGQTVEKGGEDFRREQDGY